MIRVSTSWMYQQSLNTMLSQQTALAVTQSQVSTGDRITVASDDPGGVAQAIGLSHILANNTQYSSNIDSANTQLSTESNALSSVSSLLDSANDIGLQSINGSLSADDRSDMATQLIQLRDQLVQLANSSNANGTALFAGSSTTATPFTANADGSVSYVGNDASTYASVGDGLTVASTDSGSSVFMNVPAGNGSFVASAGASNTGNVVVGANSVTDSAQWNSDTATGPVNYTISFDADGNWSATEPTTDANGVTTQTPVLDSDGKAVGGTYTDGGSISFKGISVTLSGTPAAGDTVDVQSGTSQDVFTTLNNMIGALQGGSSGTDLSNTMNRQLEALNGAMDNVSSTQVAIGSRMATLQQQQSSYSDLSVTYQSALSDVQNVDLATAISNLSMQSTALQASQQVFAKVQALSLFNYIQ